MSVYNGSKVVDRAIKSIINQTWQDWEFIIIDDASNDASVARIKHFQRQDKRIVFLQNDCNTGLTKSLNLGLQRSKGELIARIDDDDWWHETKLEKQVTFLTKNRNYGIIGTNVIVHLNRDEKQVKKITMPETDDVIRKVLYRRTPFVHSSVVFRKQLVEKFGGYNERLRYAQDYDLWNRYLVETSGHNLQEFLCYRSSHLGNALSFKHWRYQQYCIIKTMLKYYPVYHYEFPKYFHILGRIFSLLSPPYAKSIKHYFKSRSLTKPIS